MQRPVAVSRRAVCAVLVGALATACARADSPAASKPAAPQPTVAPSQPTAAPSPAAAQKPAAPTAAAAKPAAATAKPAADAQFEAQWRELIDATRKDGKLVLYGVPNADMRTQLPPKFRQLFGVDVEVVGVDSNDAAQRIIRESNAGQVGVDVMTSGQTTFSNVLHPAGVIVPLKPLLIHPDAKNPSVWQKGEPWFMDAEGRILRLINAATEPLNVNTEFVKADEITAAKDLLKPQYKEKISSNDPRVPGPGASNFALMMRSLGEDFIVQLVEQQGVQFTRDRRQQADWLAQGRYPITIGIGNQETAQLRRDGFKIEDVSFSDVPTPIGPAAGMLAIIKGGPHPKAAQLFLNWMITKDGMQTWCDLEGYPGTRTDLDTSKLEPGTIPKPGRDYFDTGAWEYTTQDRTNEFRRIAELFRR